MHDSSLWRQPERRRRGWEDRGAFSSSSKTVVKKGGVEAVTDGEFSARWELKAEAELGGEEEEE